MTVSTHVLDAMAGRPAGGVTVSLSRLDPGGTENGGGGGGAGVATGGEERWVPVGTGETDADGRHRFGVPAGAGVYRLTFGSGAYFAALGISTFYPFVTITFEAADGTGHYHVPLLLSPFGYSTYRGS
ncbi:MAG TPA: hydroxyisourate hydrolase [Trebonia sp.]|nr:hydroxyisourate hydrolase [Trebonia sp.]